MRATALRIRVVAEEDLYDDTARGIEDALAGRVRTPVRELVFTTVAGMRRTLTPQRLRLLRLIREQRPQSVYGLAKLAGRDRKAVTEDLKLLRRVGLVRMSRPRRKGRIRDIPSVPFSRIEIAVEV